MPSRNERITGGLWGLLVGDAVGVPYEFHAPHELPPRTKLDMVPPPDFARAHTRIPPGTWSDDGAQALALLASLLTHRALHLEDFAQRLLDWYQHGDYAVDHDVFDVGIQTRQALDALARGIPPTQSGPNHERANGNGSLMRVLPLALWHTGPDADLVHAAHGQSLVTHGHLRAQVCCALYCLWARRLLEETPDPWQNAVATLRALYGPQSPARLELDTHLRPDDPPAGHGSGYVVDCLNSARLALEADTYEAVIQTAIALGNDTDTTACVAGGLAGLREGVRAIPARWLDALRGKDIVKPLLEKLLNTD